MSTTITDSPVLKIYFNRKCMVIYTLVLLEKKSVIVIISYINDSNKNLENHTEQQSDKQCNHLFNNLISIKSELTAI